MITSTFKHPSALVPVVMSFTALTIVLFRLATFGVMREADEGTTAHLFQILMAGQIPFILFFAIKWLRRTPAQAIQVLALQGAAALAALAPVFLLHL